MIDLATNEIVHGRSRHTITQWLVWWHVEGLGLYPELQDALKVGRTVHPVPVAHSGMLVYEALPASLVVEKPLAAR